jgi:hypothetical protein
MSRNCKSPHHAGQVFVRLADSSLGRQSSLQSVLDPLLTHLLDFPSRSVYTYLVGKVGILR